MCVCVQHVHAIHAVTEFGIPTWHGRGVTRLGRTRVHGPRVTGQLAVVGNESGQLCIVCRWSECECVCPQLVHAVRRLGLAFCILNAIPTATPPPGPGSPWGHAV